MSSAENSASLNAQSGAGATALPKGLAFFNLFLVSAFLIAFETYLSRYFAITTGSEYGYLIISIVMAGLSLSGVLLSLFERFFSRHWKGMLLSLPLIMIATTIAGMLLIAANNFNPLGLQHEELWRGQLVNIFKFYLELVPAFFFAGLYFGINFVIFSKDISRVYSCNLLGSAFGSLFVLALMFFMHPFYLLAGIVPLLFLPSLLLWRSMSGHSLKITSLMLLLLLGCAALEFFTLKHPFGKFPYFKQIYSSMNIQGNRVVKKKISPAGYYIVLDNLSEFDTIDVTNNYESLGIGSAPRAYGIYRDGQHIASLIGKEPEDFSYLNGALSSFPYQLKTYPDVLLVGTAGGFRIREVLEIKPSLLVALEPDPVVYNLIKNDEAAQPALKNPQTQFSEQSPFSYLARHKQKFDIIEISPDLLSQNPDGVFLFTEEAVAAYYRALKPGGMLSVQIPISEFPVYALKMFQTVRAGLRKAQVDRPEQHVAVYRSTWTALILVSNIPFEPETISSLRTFCQDRSFDTSYFPGINPDQAEIFNDLPAISFEEQSVAESNTVTDSLMTDMISLADKGRSEEQFFSLRPSTIDRPAFFSVLKLSKMRIILRHLLIIPQEEIGNIINIVVLPQALVFAIIILFLPFARLRHIPSKKLFFRTAGYFASLGLGFLFIEMALINRLSFFLNDATSSFAFVITGMLIFSGVGSWLSEKHMENTAAGLKMPVTIIVVMLVFYIFGLPGIVDRAIDLSFALKGVMIIVLIAPVSFAMGYFFPLGIHSVSKSALFLIPWAWAVNGAFSVISTPLANLLALRYGYTLVFAASAALYLLAFAFFPSQKSK